MKTIASITGLLLLILSLLSGCKEPFPPYEEPTNILVATIAKTGADTLYITQDSTGTTIGVDPIGLTVSVRNNYTQLLQGAAQVTGRLNAIMTAPFPMVLPTTSLGQSDLIRPPVYQNAIALPPGQSAEFRATIFANLVPTLMSSVPHTDQIRADSTKVITYAPVTLQAQAEVRLFELVQPVKTEVLTFTQVYVQIILHKM
jgi:uncharacterized protein YcsI (UPF0317 family)